MSKFYLNHEFLNEMLQNFWMGSFSFSYSFFAGQLFPQKTSMKISEKHYTALKVFISSDTTRVHFGLVSSDASYP